METKRIRFVSSVLLLALLRIGWASSLEQTYCQVAGPYCLYFDGDDDYVSLGNDSSLQLDKTSMSVMTWSKMDPGNENQWIGLIGKMNFSSNRNTGFVLARYSNNQFAFFKGVGIGSMWGNVSDATYTDSEWHHVAAVIRDDYSFLYVDGVKQQDTHDAPFKDSGDEAHIGRHYSDVDLGQYPGYLDDVRFYNRGLSDSEVVYAMNHIPSLDLSLVGYWNMNEGTGGAAYDSSMYSNHGQLKPSVQDGPQWTATDQFCEGVGGVDIYYVDAVHGHDGSNGHTPQTAFRTIQRGIDATVNGNTVIVLDGVYQGAGNKELNFGGRMITVKSANGADAVTIDCQNSGRAFVFHNGEGPKSIVEGFTLMNGNSYQGGAIYCQGSSPSIRACRVFKNTSSVGGAIYYRQCSGVVLADCEIRENAPSGGVRFDESDGEIRNCLLVNNTASIGAGGAIRCDNGYRQVKIVNCTVADNQTNTNGGGLWCRYSHVIVKNSIFWHNTAAGAGPEMSVNVATATVSYSNVQGGKSGVHVSSGTLSWGAGNLDQNPRFGDRNNGDYHLMSERGRSLAEHNLWVIDSRTSPSIDAGDPADAVGNEKAPNGARINMGVYGGTKEASRSLEPDDCNDLDYNGDGVINLDDLYDMIDDWLAEWESMMPSVSSV